jgi:predicted Fe-Mo cluster-binding NifX family protein
MIVVTNGQYHSVIRGRASVRRVAVSSLSELTPGWVSAIAVEPVWAPGAVVVRAGAREGGVVFAAGRTARSRRPEMIRKSLILYRSRANPTEVTITEAGDITQLMKVCIPIEDSRGLDSRVAGHFGSSPYLLVYETSTEESETVSNGDSEHEHGRCNPVGIVMSTGSSAVIAAGLGMRAIQLLSSHGVVVFRTDSITVREALSKLQAEELPKMTLIDCCNHGGHEAGC